MSTLFDPLCLSALALALALSLPAESRDRAPQTAEQDEDKAWQATVKRGDAPAYRGYLSSRPGGPYTQAAVSALEQIARQDEAAVSEVLNRFSRPAALARLQGPAARSNALGFALGDSFLGPGTLWLGEWSARRQMLLPRGEWIAIASLEHDLTGLATLQLATVLLARADGESVDELLAVTFNRSGVSTQPGTTGIYTTPKWPPADVCAAGVANADYQLRDSDMRVRWCAAIRPIQGTADLTSYPDEFRRRVDRALAVLELSLQPFAFQSELHIGERSGAFMSYVHWYRGNGPTLVQQIGESDVVLPPDASPQARAHFLRQAHFAYHAAVAYQRSYEALELRVGTRLPGSTVERVLGRPQ